MGGEAGRVAISLLVIDLLACSERTLHLDLDSLLPGDWLIAVELGEGGVERVVGVHDLRAASAIELRADPDHAVELLSFHESELHLSPLGPLRAEASAPPARPRYELEVSRLQATRALPAAAVAHHLAPSGELRPTDASVSRAGVSLRFEYAADPAGRLRRFPRSSEFLQALLPLARRTTGFMLGGVHTISDLAVLDESRVVVMLLQMLMVVDEAETEAPRPFVPDAPGAWFPSAALAELPGGRALFRSVALSPTVHPNGDRTLWVAGVNGADEGRVWRFRVGEAGLLYERTVPIRGVQAPPPLVHLTIDTGGTVVVGAEDLFLASLSSTSTVFEPTSSLARFLEPRRHEFYGSTPLTVFLGHREDARDPHVIGLNGAWVLVGNVAEGRWTQVTDLKPIAMDSANLHILSYVESAAGAFVTTRTGYFFHQAPGDDFRLVPLWVGPGLEACADDRRRVLHHLRDLALTPSHGLTVNRDCSALLRVRLEDGYVSPLFIDDEMIATTVTATTVGLNVGEAGAGRYFVGGPGGRVDYFSPD